MTSGIDSWNDVVDDVEAELTAVLNLLGEAPGGGDSTADGGEGLGRRRGRRRRTRASRLDSLDENDEGGEAERMAAFDLDGEVHSGGEATAGTS